MHVIYYWQRGNLKATRLRFFCFIISQHIVQILLNWSDILFLSTLSQKVFLLFPLVCWMCRCKLGAAFTWPSKARVNCWSTRFILKMNRHRGQLSSAADVMGIPVAQGLWDLSFDKSPFFMSQTCASSPPEISELHKGTFQAPQKIAKATFKFAACLFRAVKISLRKRNHSLCHFFV